MKKLLLLCCIAVALQLAGCGDSNTAEKDVPTLNVYSWADYYAPEVLADFEKQYNCRVTYDVFSNNEELLAKMQAGGAQFDVIQPSDYMVSTMLKLQLLEKLDVSKLPNLKNIAPQLQKTAFDPEGHYAPAYTHGITGIVYNKKYVKTPPQHWSDLWSPEYKNHVMLLNDCREVFSMALKKNGFSNNSTNQAEIAKAFDDLKALNPSVLAYDTENLKQKFIAEEAWIGIMWSGDAAFSARENANLAFVIPDEGTLIWADTLAIPKGAKNKELAEKFINYMYDPKVSAKNFDYIMLPNANAAALPLMSAAYREDPILDLGNKSGAKGEWLTDIGDGITIYDKYWTELKTGQ